MASVLPTMCVAAMMDGRITPIALAVIVRMLLLGLIKPAFVVRHTAAWSVATLALVIVMMEAARVRLASPVRLANASIALKNAALLASASRCIMRLLITAQIRVMAKSLLAAASVLRMETGKRILSCSVLVTGECLGLNVRLACALEGLIR
mmetsp:Transcript_1048/g.3140  ORF Transcript_1048/g.3140 Transcript_1048/m.3140 type:complete len:151 (-) Transcript_1048:2425-2877(-)